MILGNESKLLEYLAAKNEVVYKTDQEIADELNVSKSSVKIYRKKLKEKGLIETKALFKGKTKVSAYELKGKR